MEKTQRWYYENTRRKIAETNETFMFDILPTITMEEFEKLADKRPELYERFRKLVENKFK